MEFDAESDYAVLFFLTLIMFYSVIYSCCYLLYGEYFWMHTPKKKPNLRRVWICWCVRNYQSFLFFPFSLAGWWIMSSKLTAIKEALMKRICKCPPLPGMSAVFIQGCCSPLSPPVAHFLPSSLLIRRLHETLPITHLVNLFHLVPLISHVPFLLCD